MGAINQGRNKRRGIGTTGEKKKCGLQNENGLYVKGPCQRRGGWGGLAPHGVVGESKKKLSIKRKKRDRNSHNVFRKRIRGTLIRDGIVGKGGGVLPRHEVQKPLRGRMTTRSKGRNWGTGRREDTQGWGYSGKTIVASVDANTYEGVKAAIEGAKVGEGTLGDCTTPAWIVVFKMGGKRKFSKRGWMVETVG